MSPILVDRRPLREVLGCDEPRTTPADS